MLYKDLAWGLIIFGVQQSCIHASVVFVHQDVSQENNLNHAALLHSENVDNNSMSNILSDDSGAQWGFSDKLSQALSSIFT